MLQVKLDAATEDRDKWLAEHNLLQRERDSWKAWGFDRQADYQLEQAKVEQLTRERDAALVKWQAANNRAVAAELRSEDNL